MEHLKNKFRHVCPTCKREYPQEVLVYQCKCKNKVVVEMNLSGLDISREEMIGRKEKHLPLIERYFEFLPLLEDHNLTHLGEGDTQLVHARNLGKHLSMPSLYLKNEINNPTGSFKDRPINVGLNRALEFNAQVVAAASSGNAANSLAAGAAKANIQCVAFVPDHASRSKISQLLLYGAQVFPVECPPGYVGDPTVEMLTRCHYELGFHPIPSFGHLNPYQMQGAKTIGYEIAEEMVPDHVVIPVGGGGLYLGNHDGFDDYRRLGIVEDIPKMHAIQGDGCAPLVKAIRENVPIKTWKNPKTLANGLADPFTWDGERVRKAMNVNGGSALAVDDESIVMAQKNLARLEGIFAEPTGVASLAGLVGLLESGIISRKDTVVVEITGHGFKDIGVVDNMFPRPDNLFPDMEEVVKRLEYNTRNITPESGIRK